MNGDTIFAPASGAGRAAIAVIRVSGPGSGPALDVLTGRRRPAPRQAVLRRLRDPRGGETLDEALVLWMPGPGSFTGEDAAELHIHGGTAVRAAVLRVLATLPDLRPAEPGEFTRRAFLSGRLDLAAVEGLADLIDAETEAQRRQALRQMDGLLAGHVARWRERLLDASALVEAGLDFTDEEDVPDDVGSGAGPLLASLRADLGRVLDEAGQGERVRDGFTVVIAGTPNAGKSTLLNALARREVALVSPVPGTTRDAIEVRCDLDGWPVTFVDTAGLRETEDVVERAGIARTRARAGTADLVLWLAPPAETGGPDDLAVGGPVLVVRSKADLLAAPSTDPLAVSAETGYGLPALLAVVREQLLAGGVTGDAIVTRERHRLALEAVVEALDRSVVALGSGAGDLAAEDLRVARSALGRITGEVGIEAVLDRIFGQFCIGK